MKESPEILTRKYLLDLLHGVVQSTDRSPKWLGLVRMLPCVKCGKTPAGTAHHIRPHAVGKRCSDYLTIPLCIDDHVLNGSRSIQNLSREEFIEEIGKTPEELVMDVFDTILGQMKSGNLY